MDWMHDVSSMGISVLVPMMRSVQKLTPSGWPLPMLVDIMYYLHETLDWAMLDVVRLLECQLKPGSQLFPEGWASFPPGVRGLCRHQWLGDGLQIGPPTLCSPWMFL